MVPRGDTTYNEPIKQSSEKLFQKPNVCFFSCDVIKTNGLKADIKSILCLCSSPGKQLDVDDQYYHTLSTSRSEPSMTTENTPQNTLERTQSMDRRESTQETPAGSSRQMRERAMTEPELPKPAKNNR